MSIRPSHPEGYVYYIRLNTEKGILYKIGFTKMESVKARYSYDNSENYKLIDKILMFKYCMYGYDMEQKIHLLLSDHRAYDKNSIKNVFRDLSKYPLFKDGQSELYKNDVLGLDPNPPFRLLGSWNSDLVRKRRLYVTAWHKSVPKEYIQMVKERDYDILDSFLIEPLFDSKDEFTKRNSEWVVSFVRWAIKNAATSFDQESTVYSVKPLPTTKNEILALKELSPAWGYEENIPKEIGRLENLEVVRFNSENIKSIPKELYELHRLTVLDLSGTEISTISADIMKLRALKVLYLRYTNITKIPSEIKYLTNLEELDLDRSFIDFLPKDIIKLKALKRLTIGARHWKFLYDLGMNKNIYVNEIDYRFAEASYREIEQIILLKYDFVKSSTVSSALNVSRSLDRSGNPFKIDSLRAPYLGIVEQTICYLNEQGTNGDLNQLDYVDICYEYIKFCSENNWTGLDEKLAQCGASFKMQSQ